MRRFVIRPLLALMLLAALVTAGFFVRGWWRYDRATFETDSFEQLVYSGWRLSVTSVSGAIQLSWRTREIRFSTKQDLDQLVATVERGWKWESGAIGDFQAPHLGDRHWDGPLDWRGFGFGVFEETRRARAYVIGQGTVETPGWFVFAVLAVPPVIWLLAIARKRRRLRRLRCKACGYDLRESEDGCPECGRSAETA